MNKNIGYFSIAWIICLAVFNTITFVVPHSIGNFDWYAHSSFWIGYGFIMFSFVCQLLLGIKMFVSKKNHKIFLRLSLQVTLYSALIICLIIGSIFMSVPVLPEWIAAIVCVIVTGYYVFAYLKVSVAINYVEKVDININKKTALMKELVSESNSLMSYAKTETAQIATHKVYEELKYSDPLSSDKLYYIEKEISEAYIVFADKVKNNIEDGILEQADKLCLMIKDRNNQCKLLK